MSPTVLLSPAAAIDQSEPRIKLKPHILLLLLLLKKKEKTEKKKRNNNNNKFSEDLLPSNCYGSWKTDGNSEFLYSICCKLLMPQHTKR
jgi:hypothetical protein